MQWPSQLTGNYKTKYVLVSLLRPWKLFWMLVLFNGDIFYLAVMRVFLYSTKSLALWAHN